MFTGIVQRTGKVAQVTPHLGGNSLGSAMRIETGFPDLTLGESVAVNGVCLTVTEFTSQGHALFFISKETLDRTNLGDLRSDSLVNLERALQAGDRLSGHIVQGHVDGIAILKNIQLQGESHLVEFEIPAEVSRYCVEKGSITLDGVSLTINSIQAADPQSESPSEKAMISITLIPHTWNHTCFQGNQPGDRVNVEVDVLAKYVEKLCQPYRKH
jgi:riboflavin synthase